MKPSPESSIQERGDVFVWLVFHTIAIWCVVSSRWSAFSKWLRFKRVCKWHTPQPVRMGGNPFARKVTHGMCPECFAKQRAEILSHPKF